MAQLRIVKSRLQRDLTARRKIVDRAFAQHARRVNAENAKTGHRYDPSKGPRGFGGGGATGSWGWWPGNSRKAKPKDVVTVALIGDTTCPAAGVRKWWDYAVDGSKVYGPHPHGMDGVFLGWVDLVQWGTNNKPFWNDATHDVWSLANNHSFFATYLAGNYAYTPCIAAPYTGVANGRPNLPDPYLNSDGRAWFEWVQSTRSSGSGCSGSNRKYECEMGNLMEVKQELCTPPELKPVSSPEAFDRWKKSSYPYDPADVGDRPEDPRNRENDDIDPWIVPPFVFVTPLVGAPRPAIVPITRPPPRSPPKRGTKERKPGKLRMLLRLVDAISEGAESVDCMFKALPKQTQRKWSKDRPNRGLLDKAGQYGLEGADWKAAAVWHNWHAMDVDKAMECIVANQIEDKIVGAIARRVPPGTGTAIGRSASAKQFLEKRKEQEDKWKAIRAANAARVRAGRR